jgi:hypothetical protein
MYIKKNENEKTTRKDKYVKNMTRSIGILQTLLRSLYTLCSYQGEAEKSDSYETKITQKQFLPCVFLTKCGTLQSILYTSFFFFKNYITKMTSILLCTLLYSYISLLNTVHF